jgi:hypothetical protein
MEAYSKNMKDYSRHRTHTWQSIEHILYIVYLLTGLSIKKSWIKNTVKDSHAEIPIVGITSIPPPISPRFAPHREEILEDTGRGG